MKILTMIIGSAYTRAAVYAASGYLIAHGLTGAHTWVEACLAAALAVLGLIHASTKPAPGPPGPPALLEHEKTEMLDALRELEKRGA